MELTEIRKKLDSIDENIVKLYLERIKVCKDVAEYKAQNKKAVLDTKRELEKLDSVKAMTDDAFSKKALEELYRQIMTVSRRYQYSLLATDDAAEGFKKGELKEFSKCNIVYQGVPGAYSHMAARGFFGSDAMYFSAESFDAAMDEVELGKADYAVIPIENSTAGSVVDTYDLLVKHKLYIVGECKQRISHVLLGISGSKLEDIKEVYSHPQGLMQCQEYLDMHKDIKRTSMSNTAVAAMSVKEEGDITKAAIASPIAGEIYGLEVLDSDISMKDNTTRFVILSRDKIYKNDAATISLIFELPHKSGALYNMLGNFIFNDINMLRIESRPIREKSFEYRFFVDIEGKLSQPNVKNALAGIKAEAAMLRVIGNY